MIEVLVAIELATFHTADGRLVQVNPAAVQQLIHMHQPHKFMVEGVHCVIQVGASFVSVRETCEEVEQVLEGKKQ